MSNSSADGRDAPMDGLRALSIRAWLILLVSALALPAAAALGGMALALFSKWPPTKMIHAVAGYKA